MNKVLLILWIFAYSLSGLTITLGGIYYAKKRRNDVLMLSFFHLIIFFITIFTLAFNLSLIKYVLFAYLIDNTLLILFLIIPGLIHSIELKTFPVKFYIFLFGIAVITFNFISIFKKELLNYQFIYFLPLYPIIYFSLKRAVIIEGDNEKKDPFFSSIFKVSYTSLYITMFITILVFFVHYKFKIFNSTTIGIIYGICYCIFTTPALVYFFKKLLIKETIDTKDISIEDSPAFKLLSNREQDVARLLIQGKKYKEIGEELFISMSTVKKHANNIYRKTNTSNARLLIQKLGKESTS